MNKKPLAVAVLASAATFSGVAYAQADNMGFALNGNIALTTDYRYRGISQSDEGPAVQGGFDLGHESGLYAGVWASSVEFGATGNSIEMDYYAGFAGKIVDKVSFDVGYIYYDYPKTFDEYDDLDFSEIYASVSFAGFTLGVAYAPTYALDYDDGKYIYLDYAASLPAGFSLGLHFGYSDIGKDDDGFEYLGDGTYTDYSISISKEVMGVNLGLAWVDTDVDETDCATDLGSDDTICDDAFVFTISKTN